MPTYGYRCLKCNVTFERFQAISDPPVDVCPECGGPTRRLFYPVGIVFKGTGFHVTDYPKAGSRRRGGNGEAPSAEKKDTSTGTTSKDTPVKDSAPKDAD